jgi:hypothetical protein
MTPQIPRRTDRLYHALEWRPSNPTAVLFDFSLSLALAFAVGFVLVAL